MGLIIVDTSIWIDHLREPSPTLSKLLDQRTCLMHPLVILEVALGNVPSWSRRVAQLRSLPVVEPLPLGRMLDLIQQRRLQGSGLGSTDLHILASTLDDPSRRLWTRDKRLLVQAEAAGVAWSPS